MGAFGGRKDIMSRYDPRVPGAFRHAGTFNNNVCSMMAGLAGLTRVFTPERAGEFLDTCERFRQNLNAEFAADNSPIRFTGLGSMFTIHFARTPIKSPKDIPPVSRKLGQLFHLETALRSILVASRGDIFVSLVVSPAQLQDLRQAIMAFADTYRPLLERELSATH